VDRKVLAQKLQKGESSMGTQLLAPPEVELPASTERVRKEFRLIPHFEFDPAVVSFSQTTAGKLALLAVFGLTLSVLDDRWWIKLVLVSCMAFVPKARHLLVVVGAILLTEVFWFEGSTLTRFLPSGSLRPSRWSELLYIVLPLVILSAALMWFATKYRKSVIARRPLLSLLAICGLLISVACYAPLSGFPRFATWAFLLTFCGYLWYLAYALSDCATGRGQPVFYQFGALRPFWAMGHVPVPKGWSYWRKIEAKSAEELAITMIKGVKLIVWCLLLSLLQTRYLSFVHQRLGIPSPGDCVQAVLLGRPLPMVMNWLSWPTDLLADVLSISVQTHAFIATCRMAGFRALRNTYAPLSSRTIAEYWNRYYYYFKELLVEMFFYPTFIRCFKRHPRVRIFFATFVAASLGNTLYHFLYHLPAASILGLRTFTLGFRGYLVYSFLLALGISVSQLRSRKSLGHRGWFRERVVAPACVLGFYCFVHVFLVATPSASVRYLAYLFSGR
jgi:hypothetical protein